jgi:hypothetical protein
MILRSALLAFEDEHAQEHDAEQRNPLFPQTFMLNASVQ